MIYFDSVSMFILDIIGRTIVKKSLVSRWIFFAVDMWTRICVRLMENILSEKFPKNGIKPIWQLRKIRKNTCFPTIPIISDFFTFFKSSIWENLHSIRNRYFKCYEKLTSHIWILIKNNFESFILLMFGKRKIDHKAKIIIALSIIHWIYCIFEVFCVYNISTFV